MALKIDYSVFKHDATAMLSLLAPLVKELGYIRDAEYLEPSDTGVQLTVKYVRETGQSISVYIHGNGYVNASISPPAKSSGSDSFLFSEYLSKKTKMQVLGLSPANKGQPWQERASDGLRVVAELLRGDLRDVALGKTWIDVPRDWSAAGR